MLLYLFPRGAVVIDAVLKSSTGGPIRGRRWADLVGNATRIPVLQPDLHPAA
ncbi:MAG: hypothetical protein AAFQ45_03155 [Pseudomonadota bacterium]